MLILSRRCGEAIVIDERRIGIDAPDDVNVHREEIYQRILAGEDTGYGSDAANSQPDKSARLASEEPISDAPDRAANEDTNIAAEK